jgi:hypothetical protein
LIKQYKYGYIYEKLTGDNNEYFTSKFKKDYQYIADTKYNKKFECDKFIEDSNWEPYIKFDSNDIEKYINKKNVTHKIKSKSSNIVNANPSYLPQSSTEIVRGYTLRTPRKKNNQNIVRSFSNKLKISG